MMHSPLRTLGALMVAGLLTMAGCASPVPIRPTEESISVSAVAPLGGQVVFPGRQVQALASDATNAASVSLIATANGVTATSAVSDSSGNFRLDFPVNFVPVSGATYYLEAVKGLSNNQPGHSAARVRTIVQFDNGNWLSITNGQPSGTLVVNAATTALAVAAALRSSQGMSVSYTSLIGSFLDHSNTYTPVTNLGLTDFNTVQSLVLDILSRDRDPVEAVSLSGQNGWQALDTPAPMLTAVDNPLVNAGSLLTLEGAFADGASASFPGAGSVPMQMVSSHRAQVIAPSTATSGGLSITQPGGNSNSLPYRVASYGIGLGGFSRHFDQSAVGGFTALTTARYGQTTAVIGNHLYVFGGYGNSPLASVERAAIRVDGSIGPFTLVPGVSLALARENASAAVIGRYVYIFGGSGTFNSTTSVERATINNDGSISTFSLVQGLSLSTGRTSAASAVVGRHVYLFGGFNSSLGQLASVERATILTDGTLGSFSPVGSSTLTVARNGPSANVIGNYVYVLGGVNASGRLASVERALVHADGSLGAFSAVSGSSMNDARQGHSSIVLGNHLYVLGGFGINGILTSVERAVIGVGGSLGAFSTVPGASLRTARYHLSCAVVGNYLYVLGGVAPGGATSVVERASINSTGSVENFSAAGSSLFQPSPKTHVVAVGDSFYVFGFNVGSPFASDHAERFSVDRDGTITNQAGFSIDGTASRRLDTCTAVIGDYIYIIGGNISGVISNTIERAQIQDDGSLDGFTSVPNTSLVAGRAAHSCAVIGNYLYVFGGWNIVALSSVERAPILADGSLGTFSVVSNLSSTRYHHTSAVIGNFVYILAGTNGTPHGTYERAAINPDGSLGSFSTVGSLTGRYNHSSAVIGTMLYMFGGLNNSGTVSNIERAVINADDSLAPFTTHSGTMPQRYGHATIVVGNRTYQVGGSNNALERAILN